MGCQSLRVGPMSLTLYKSWQPKRQVFSSLKPPSPHHKKCYDYEIMEFIYLSTINQAILHLTLILLSKTSISSASAVLLCWFVGCAMVVDSVEPKCLLLEGRCPLESRSTLILRFLKVVSKRD